MNPNAFQGGGGGGGISPAMLNAFQNRNNSNNNPVMSINPSQLMNGGGGGGGGGGGINPAAIQQQQQQSNINIQNLLSAAGLSREQFVALPSHEKQNLATKYMQMAAQQQQMMMNMQSQHNQQQQGHAFERPSSSASTHSSHQQQQNQHMMPPPPPRPPTAQGQHISRPGTSLSHRSPTIPGPGLGSMMDAQLIQRPQSRMAHPDGMMNGFKQGQTQQQGQQQQFNNLQGNTNASGASSGGGGSSTPNPILQQGGGSSSNHTNNPQNMQQTMHVSQQNPYPQPPAPSTSPTGSRGAKRKVGDMTGGGGGGMPVGNGMGMGGGNGNMGMNNMMGMGNANNNMNISNMGMGGNMGMGANNMNMGTNNMGMGNMNMMSNNPMAGGMPGSPRINSMGPPGLPRSISGDGMGGANVNLGGMGMGGMGNNMGNNMGMSMGMGNNNVNVNNLGGMGMNTANNNMNMGMMNGGARGSPRPQSAMGMSGPLGSMNSSMNPNMNAMNMNNINTMGLNNMGMNMPMLDGSPSISSATSSSGPRPQIHQTQSQPAMSGGSIALGPAPGTPMRHGSLGPQTPNMGNPGMGMGGMQGMGGMGGGMGMGNNMQGMSPMGGQQGMSMGMNNNNNMNMNIGGNMGMNPMRQGSVPPGGMGGGAGGGGNQGMPQMARRPSATPQQGMSGMGSMGSMNNMGMGGVSSAGPGNMGGMGMGGGGGGGMQTQNQSMHPSMPSSPLPGANAGGGLGLAGLGMGGLGASGGLANINIGGLGGAGGAGALPLTQTLSGTGMGGMGPGGLQSSMSSGPGMMSGGLGPSSAGLGGLPSGSGGGNAGMGLALGGPGLNSSSILGGGASLAASTSTPPLSASASISGLGGGMGSASSSAPNQAQNLGSSSSASASGIATLAPLTSTASASLNPHTTLITPVPLLTSLTTIPALSAEEINNVKEWMEVDRGYEAKVRAMKIRGVEEARAVFGGPPGTTANSANAQAIKWWERGALGNGMGNWSRFRRPGPERFDIRYPIKRKDGYGHGHVTTGRSGRKEKRREGLKLPRKIDAEDANRPEMLVPIRIEFDVEHHKMRDTFIWNLNDPVVSPEAFAQSIVDDYALAPTYHSVIVKSIQDQLTDYKIHSTKYDGDLNELSDTEELVGEHGTLDGIAERWWAAWRRQVKVEGRKAVKDAVRLDAKGKGKMKGGRRKKKAATAVGDGVDVKNEDGDDVSMLADDEFANEQDDEDEDADADDGRRRKGVVVSFEDENEDEDDEFRPLTVDEIKLDERAMHDDMRIVVKLDIIVASIKLDDQFEWDLDNPTASPEEFAEVYTQELGLGGEFKTAIAHSIREQVQTYQKSLFLIGHHPIDSSAVQDDDLKSSFLPSLTAGARPVSEVQMFTPLLNYLSDGELERTEKERDKDLNKRRKRNTRGRRGIALPDREPIRTYRTPAIGFPELDAATLALAAAANAPMSRRAAAAAASLTIANMVASENGTAFMPQAMPSVAAQQPAQVAPAQKDKKPKGLFKAPGVPSSVLRPRAQVAAPTPSTAADTSGMPSVPTDSEAPRSSSTIPNVYDSRTNRVLSAKRAKELEREAKEKEFMDGQHLNYIDGVWHCSNCGCPESIAVGRRKGPLGDKSQCGTCGKYWHRHRRPRPVEYNPDPNFHSGIKQKESDALRTPANKKKGAAAALRAAAHSATPAGDTGASEAPTPAGRSNGDGEPSSRMSPTPGGGLKDEDDRAISPISSASSASEAPLAQKVKLNGTHSKPAATPAPTPVTPVKAESNKNTAADGAGPSASTSTPAAAAAPVSPSRTWPPPWLSAQLQLMQTKYPNDRFEVILRKVNASSTAEWRIKCSDCPGKLYTPGPAETLANYEVHLKNRQHRQRVNDRVSGTSTAPTATNP